MTKKEVFEMIETRGLVAEIKNEGNYILVSHMIHGQDNEFIEYSMNQIFYEHNELGEIRVQEAIEKGYSFYFISEENISERNAITRSVYDGHYGCDEVIRDVIISLKEGAKKIPLYRKEVKVGLIEGRHPLPVEGYMLKEIKNVLDFQSIEREVRNWINKNITFKKVMGGATNQCDYTDVMVFTSVERLVVYITGLTAVTAAVIKVSSEMGVKLTLMHYDREEDRYLPQQIF